MKRTQRQPAVCATTAPAAFGMVAAACLSAIPLAPARAQSVRGTVLDAATFQGIASAEVRARSGRARPVSILTDEEGSFLLHLPEAGDYRVWVEALSYVTSDSTEVAVAEGEEVEVLVRLSASPIAIAPITVLARGFELRHRATFEGFLQRRETARDVGSSRVLSREDPELKTAGTLGDVFKWINTTGRGCTVVYVDGFINTGFDDWPIHSAVSYEGVEYYARSEDAPVELRDGGPPCLRAPTFSVLALWRRRRGGG